MKRNYRAAAFCPCVLALVMLASTFASAQLGTSVGDPLAPPLDDSLNGLDSSVAPIPTSQIEPGAGNLQTPEERILPYDAIGASLVATPMTPSASQYFTVSRAPFQVDAGVRDVTIITGIRSPSPINIVDTISRKTGRLESSSLIQSSYFGHSSLSPTGSLSDKTRLSPGGSLLTPDTQQSTWKVGGSAALVNLPPPSPPATQAPEPTSELDRSDAARRKKKQRNQAEQADPAMQKNETVQDYSRSPLEAAVPDPAMKAASPFKGLNQNSFLNPDISGSLRHGASATGETKSLSAREQAKLPKSRISGTSKDANLSRSELRLKQESKVGQGKKPKWHNPILQRWEEQANSTRR